MSLLVTIHGRGVLASRPAASAANEAYIWYATDTGALSRSNGSSWDAYSSGGLADQGVVTYLDFTTAAAPGSPAAGKVRLYSVTGGHLTQKDSSGTAAPLDSGGGGGSVVASTISPTSDTYINQQAATTNADTDTVLYIADRWVSGSYDLFPLLTFDITSLVGKLVVAADLRFITITGGNAGVFTGRLQVRRLRRAYVSNQATWNVYSTGNNWTTAGAAHTDDRDQVSVAELGWSSNINFVADREIIFDLGPLVRQLLSESVTDMRIIIGTDVATGSQNPIIVHSLESATSAKRPILNVLAV